MQDAQKLTDRDPELWLKNTKRLPVIGLIEALPVGDEQEGSSHADRDGRQAPGRAGPPLTLLSLLLDISIYYMQAQRRVTLLKQLTN